MSQSPQLLKFLFHPEIPQLRLPPEELLREALGFSSGDLILVRIAIDLWCEQGNLPLHQVFGLDSLNFKLTLQALEVLGP